MFSAIYPYLPLLFSHFVFLFSLSFSFSSRYGHILQFTMFNTNSLQPARNITEIKKMLHSPLPSKKFPVNYNQPNAPIFKWNKVWVFSSFLSNYFLLSFDQAHALTSHFNENSYFETKRSLNNTPHRKFSLNCKQHSRTRTCLS